MYSTSWIRWINPAFLQLVANRVTADPGVQDVRDMAHSGDSLLLLYPRDHDMEVAIHRRTDCFWAFTRIGCTTQFPPFSPSLSTDVYNVTLSTWSTHEAHWEKYHLWQLMAKDNTACPIAQRDLEDAHQLMAQTVWS
ncbi:hypothetical protein AbraIFM66950_004905 [Aspergillus brasiliensis]|nr:hypothetical protein AbraIFM66950_004905 [Aspergillus brasiliensis]